MRIKLPTLRCRRCEHRWIPRGTEVVICPKCKSALWQTPRKNRQGLRPEKEKR